MKWMYWSLIRTGARLIAAILSVLLACHDPAAAETTLENFEDYQNGAFPGKWRARNREARRVYRIDSEGGNRFLHAHADNQGFQIALERAIDPRHQSRLRWRWRVQKFPHGADER